MLNIEMMNMLKDKWYFTLTDLTLNKLSTKMVDLSFIIFQLIFSCKIFSKNFIAKFRIFIVYVEIHMNLFIINTTNQKNYSKIISPSYCCKFENSKPYIFSLCTMYALLPFLCFAWVTYVHAWCSKNCNFHHFFFNSPLLPTGKGLLLLVARKWPQQMRSDYTLAMRW